MNRTYEETTALLRAIAHADTPPTRIGFPPVMGRKARAVAVRQLCKELGLKGISVTAPNYAQAHSIDIRLPDYAETEHHCSDHGRDMHYNRNTDCRQCMRRAAAKARLNTVILAAFPGMADRSEYQSDYFDFQFTID